MSLRSEGYEPAMAKRTATTGDVAAALALAVGQTAIITAQRTAFFNFPHAIQSGTPEGDAFEANITLNTVNVDLVNILGTIATAPDPIFMKDLGDTKLPHASGAGARVRAGLFHPSVKARSAYPDTWPSRMVHDAEEKRRLAGSPKLTGNAFGH